MPNLSPWRTDYPTCLSNGLRGLWSWKNGNSHHPKVHLFQSFLLFFRASSATGGIDDNIYIFPQNHLLCNLKTSLEIGKKHRQKPPFVMLNHRKPPSLYLKKGVRDFPMAWSRRAAVFNPAGWWRIEEEIEVKRSRSQDLERGRGCDHFFDAGWYEKRLKLTRFLKKSKSAPLAAQ